MQQSIYTDGRYLQLHPNWHEEDAPFKAKYVIRLIDKHQIPLKTVAEIGTGSGEVLRILSQRYPEAQFTGLEISEDALKIARNKLGTNLHFQADNGSENFPLTAVDLILFLDVFEHVPDYLGFLRAWKLKPGKKIFHIPLDINVLDVLRAQRLSRKRSTAGHLHYFTKNTALDTLRDCNFNIIDYQYTPWCLELHHSFAARMRNLIIAPLFHFFPDFTVRFFGGFSLMVLCE